ncbi:MAG: polyribonucleotide nucleotidyltransferase, partial [Chitinispirillaceae bacterium]|nr:polyribonucleotide nucleotidyltransferase [Chitinispirillaceae bacterium]
MPLINVESEVAGVKVSIETGRMAKQAGGASVVRIGNTMVLATACSGREPENAGFFPLSVEYIEKTYAAGKIPGGFFKREGRPSEKEILSCRLVDRPIRPLFPDRYRNEVQIICTVISADEHYDASVLAITAAATALSLSDIPLREPVAAVRIGQVDGRLKVFPTLVETEASPFELVVAGTESSIMMVEGGAWEVSEGVIVEALTLAHDAIRRILKMVNELLEKAGKKKAPYVAPEIDPALVAAVEELVKDRLHELSFKGIKQERYSGVKKLLEEVQEALAEKFPDQQRLIEEVFTEIESRDIRDAIVSRGERIGGRGLDEIRPITCELDILPQAHGSALFTRGETQ